ADDPRLTVRGPVVPRVAPTRVVFDRTLRLPPTSTLAVTAAEAAGVVVAATDASTEREGALEAAGVRVLRASGGVEQTLETLREAGFRSMFVEGGAEIAGALLAAGAVDRLYLFYAPLFLGPRGLDPFAALESPAIAEAPRWRRVDTQAFGADTLVTLARE
ncbi:MAG: RibD family protein, partial [Longimicrobiaceae bacterium]